MTMLRTFLCAASIALLASSHLATHANTTSVTTSTSSQRTPPALVDDSATVVLDPVPQMSWRNHSPKSRDNAIVGQTRVNVKLTTSPWLGRKGKIYMVMPAETTGSVMITWRGKGQLGDGKLRSGGRTLVYNGTIRSPRIEDIWEVQIEADGTRISQAQQMRIYFEIEVE